MLLERRNPAYLDSRPATFAALMEMYEENYLALRRLCPEPARLPPQSVSRVSGALDLHLEVLERTRYTTTLHLTYHFDHDGEPRRQPDVRVRMFHDAHQAEVLELHCRGIGAELAAEMRTGHPGLMCRWRHNRFLYKWLRYCLRQGHRFRVDASPEVVALD